MARSARQLKILELISKKEIETQDELAFELQQANFAVTQATISRDIKELGLVKVAGENKRQKYSRDASAFSMSGKISNMFRHAVLSIDYALNVVVLKTLAGAASSSGIMIDRMSNEDILGSVAGDDTLIIITRSENAAKNLVEILSDVLNQ